MIYKIISYNHSFFFSSDLSLLFEFNILTSNSAALLTIYVLTLADKLCANSPANFLLFIKIISKSFGHLIRNFLNPFGKRCFVYYF